MYLFEIEFESGRITQEYGNSVLDVRKFCHSVYRCEVIKSVKQL